MRRLVDVLRWSLFALALLLLGAVAIAWGAESTGWLAHKLSRELSRELGEPIAIESVDVDWFEPRVAVEGVALRDAAKLARLERITAYFDWNGIAAPRLTTVEITGGRIVLGDELFERIEKRATGAQTASASTAPMPAVVVRDIQVDLEHPAWGAIALGRVDALGLRDEQGTVQLEGRVTPSFAAGRDIVLTAQRDARGRSRVHLWASRIPINEAAFPASSPLAPARKLDPRGVLSLDLQASYDESGAAAPTGRLRLALENASLQPLTKAARVEDVALDLEAICTPRNLGGLLDPRAWENTLHATASWNGHALDAWALAGRNAGAGLAARAWITIPCVPLSRELLSAFGLAGNRIAETQWHALSPSGFARIAIGLAWPSGAPDAKFDPTSRPIATAEIELDGDATIQVNGWPSRGRTEGFPLPVEGLAGRAVALHDARREHDTLLGLVRTLGAHSAGDSATTPAFAEGLLRWTMVGVSEPEVELRFGAHAVPIDERVHEALRNIHDAEFVERDFAPDGGTASIAARISKRDDERLPTLEFRVDLQGSGATWAEMPAPLRALDGQIELVFDPQHRFGARFDLRGETNNGAEARIRGRVHDDANPALARGMGRRVQAFEVEVRGIGLRGDDRRMLLEKQVDVREALERLGPEGELDRGPQGKVDVRYQAATRTTGGPFDWRVEVTPHGALQFTPQEFPVQWLDVAGRVVVTGEHPLVLGAGPSRGEARVIPFVGNWTRQTRVAATAELPFDGEREVQFFGAGIDVKNTDLIGAFRTLFEQYDSVSLDALRVDGRVDLTGTLLIPSQAPQTPVGIYRVRLRDNDVRLSVEAGASERGLDGLSGLLVQRGDELRGERITASLASSPLLLRKARFFERDGRFTFETNLDAREFPLDEKHLGLFLDPATVTALCDGLQLGGTVDVEAAKLELSFANTARGDRVRFEGRALASNAFVDIGLPLSIDSAEIDIEQLVYEADDVRVEALVRGLAGRVADRALEDTRLRLTYVEPHVSILELDGTLEGGRLGGFADEHAHSGGSAFSMDLEAPFPFDLAVRLTDVEIGGLLRGLFESDFASSGLLSAELRLAGDLERMTGIHGEGQVEMRDTVLWSIPVVREMFARLGFDDAAVFERVRSRFQIADGEIRMSDLRVSSALLSLVGSGVLDFDGSLDHELEVRYGLVDRLGPLRRVLYWVQNNLLRVSIKGDMSRPRIELGGVLGWMQSSKRGPRELPLPPLAPLPERF